MTKNEHIKFWLNQADDDWLTVEALFKSKRYVHSLFFAHLCLEKICKAIWVKDNKNNFPPYTHNLNKILSKTKISLTKEQKYFLEEMLRFQIEGRYSNYINNLYKVCTKIFCKNILEQTKEIKLCLLKNLQKI